MPDEYTPEEKIDLARVELLIDHPFFGQLVLQLSPTPTKELQGIGPAATDGVHLYYDEEWIAKYTPDEVKAIMAHEVLHVAFGHTNGHSLNRTGTRDPKRWNYATDAVVNHIILNDIHGGSSRVVRHPMVLPEGGITVDKLNLQPPLDKDILDYAAEDIYERIVMPPDNEGDGCYSCGLLDPKSGDQGRGKGTQGQGPKVMTDAEVQIWRAKMQASYEAARNAGKAPGGLEVLLDGLNKPRKDWREELALFVQRVMQDYAWLPPDRRSQTISKMMGRRVILPSLSEGDEVKDIVIAIDSSGSIGHEELIDFCSEAHGIAQIGVNLWLVFCDAAIQGWHELTPSPDFPSPSGRGGTTFDPVFEEVKRRGINPEALVYFTDGYPSHWPDPPDYPVLWVINTDVDPPWGKTIRYEARQR